MDKTTTPATTKTELQQVDYSPASLISQAIEKGLGVEGLERLVALQERWEATQARKAFFQAFTSWQLNAPDLRKNKEVKFNQTTYKYAPLADICRQINKPLKENDLSYRWEIADDGDKIKVTCLVSHITGHTERTTMQVSPDASGSKNSIQARGSAIEYAKRYTLIGALGISTSDSDIDGRLPDDTSVDDLHTEFMREFNQLVQLDESYAKLHPDNWKGERNAVNYKKAIGDIRKKLFDLQQKAK